MSTDATQPATETQTQGAGPAAGTTTDAREPALPGILAGPGTAADPATAIKAPTLSKAKKPASLAPDEATTMSVLAQLGLASVEEVEHLRAASKELERLKPDEKTKRELEQLRATATRLQGELKTERAAVAALEKRDADREHQRLLADWERFVHDVAGVVAKKVNLAEGPMAQADLERLIRTQMRMDGEGEQTRIVFEEGATRFESGPGGIQGDDTARLIETLTKHVTATRPAWVQSRAPAGAGTGRTFAIANPLAPPRAPNGTRDDRIAQFLRTIPTIHERRVS